MNLFFIFLVSFYNLAFTQPPLEPQTPKSSILPEKTMFSENIVYKTNNNGESLALDIYKPKTATSNKLPVVVYVHGGAWAKGDKIVRSKSYIEDFILKLVEKNYAVVSIDYTLVSETVHFPLPIQDTKDAIRWIRKNADKYNFDTNNIGYFGASSGAHLSMLSAYSDDNKFVGSSDLAAYSGKVNYVVSNFGPTDLNKLLHTRMGKFPVSIVGLFIKPIVELREKLVLGISGFDIKEDKRKVVDYFETVSPINYVEQGVPTFILHGNKDKVAPIKQSKKIVRKLKKANVQTSLVVVKDGLHGFGKTDKAYMDQLIDEMITFINAQKK